MWHNTTDGFTKIYTAAGKLNITTGAPPGGLAIEATVHQSGVNVWSLSQTITHAANADIIIIIALPGGAISSVKVGGADATVEGTPNTVIAVYRINRAAAATETITVTFSAIRLATGFIASSITGSTAHAWEGIAYTLTKTVTIAVGTAGRLIIHGIVGGNSNPTIPTITLDAQLIEIDTVTASGTVAFREKEGSHADPAGAAHTFLDTSNAATNACAAIAIQP
jgi:hypothetical protein